MKSRLIRIVTLSLFFGSGFIIGRWSCRIERKPDYNQFARAYDLLLTHCRHGEEKEVTLETLLDLMPTAERDAILRECVFVVHEFTLNEESKIELSKTLVTIRDGLKTVRISRSGVTTIERER